MLFNLIRFILVITGTVVGVALGYGLIDQYGNFLEIEHPGLKFAALLGCLGYLLSSMAGRELDLYLQAKIETTNSYDLAWAALGLVFGLISANLLLIPVYFILYKDLVHFRFDNQYFNSLVPLITLVIPVFFNLLFAYLGASIVSRYRRGIPRHLPAISSVPPKALDTSVIVDGRIADLIRMSFMEGTFLVPRFVLNELQFLADSGDQLKRKRGRQALDLLKALRKEYPDNFLLTEKDYPQVEEVDAKLIEFTRDEAAVMVTLDFNLKRVAELQNVKVLYLQDLVSIFKPPVQTGEELEIQILKPGKETEQGVAFLPDGTMVVVEDGGHDIGKKVKITVTNILQTTGGRMVFGRIHLKKKAGS
ncbi:MAG TPA: TRAM domain-containing protein [Candidatus Ozemobacteraceae bacterium]|nr:TRAM domain-containing protein [Candidatus Ozemobacteraceae bacterium]